MKKSQKTDAPELEPIEELLARAAVAYTALLDPRKPGRPPTDGVAATGHVHIRTTLDRKSAWVRAAHPKTLAEWVTKTLDAAAKYESRRSH